MRRMDTYRWVGLASLVLLVLWLTGGLGNTWHWAAQRFDLMMPTAPQPRPEVDVGETNRDDDDDMPVVQPTTRIVFRTAYSPCQLEAREEYDADFAQIGQTEEQFQMYYPGWQVVEFTRERVVAERLVADRCEELMAKRTITIYNGLVTVFYGEGGEHSPVMTKTDVSADELVPGDRERLENGVTVEDEREVWLIIEGLTR